MTTKKILNFIALSLILIFVILTKLMSIRFMFSYYYFYYLLVLPAAYLWYKFTKQADRSGKWNIDKYVLLISTPFIIFVIACSYAVTEGSNLKIVLIATLIAILLSILFSLYKEKDGDF